MSLEFLGDNSQAESLERISEQAFAINEQRMNSKGMSGRGPKYADRADFREGLRLYVARELLTARRDEAKESHEKIAVDEGRRLYLINRALELQQQIDAIDAEIARQRGRK